MIHLRQHAQFVFLRDRVNGAHMNHPLYRIFHAERRHIPGAVHIHIVEHRRYMLGNVDDSRCVNHIHIAVPGVLKHRTQALLVPHISRIIMYIFPLLKFLQSLPLHLIHLLLQHQTADFHILFCQHTDNRISQMSVGSRDNHNSLHIYTHLSLFEHHVVF